MRPGSPFALPTSLRSIVFTTQSVVILEWAEKVRAGQAVTFGLERAIFDRLGLLDLAERPRADAIGRGDADLDLVEGLGLRGLIGEGGQFVHGYEPLSNLFPSPIGRGRGPPAKLVGRWGQGSYLRSEESRVGNEGASTCRYRWSPYP